MGRHKTYKSGDFYLYHVQCSCGKCIERLKRFKGIKKQDLDGKSIRRS